MATFVLVSTFIIFVDRPFSLTGFVCDVIETFDWLQSRSLAGSQLSGVADWCSAGQARGGVGGRELFVCARRPSHTGFALLLRGMVLEMSLFE